MIYGQQLENTMANTNTDTLVNTASQAMEGIEIKHFEIELDKDGKEIRVEINPPKEEATAEVAPA